MEKGKHHASESLTYVIECKPLMGRQMAGIVSRVKTFAAYARETEDLELVLNRAPKAAPFSHIRAMLDRGKYTT